MPVSALAGLGRGQVMPPVTGLDLFSVRADVAVFLTLVALNMLRKVIW